LALNVDPLSVLSDFEDIEKTVAEVWKMGWGEFVPDAGESFSSELDLSKA
jgi:hypothetical protein